MGLLGLPFAEEHGGFGGSAVDMCVVMEAIGEGLLVEPYLPTVGLGGRFIARGGSKAQQERILPALIEGKHEAGLRPHRAAARATTWPGRSTGAPRRARAGCSTATRRVVAARRQRRHARRLGAHRRRRRGRRRHHAVPRRAHGARRDASRTPARSTSLRAADIRFERRALRPPTRCWAARATGCPVIEEVVDYATALLCAEAVGAMTRRQRGHARIPEDAPAVRRADRQLPGAAAPHGRHADQLRAGALDGLSGLR